MVHLVSILRATNQVPILRAAVHALRSHVLDHVEQTLAEDD